MDRPNGSEIAKRCPPGSACSSSGQRSIHNAVNNAIRGVVFLEQMAP